MKISDDVNNNPKIFDFGGHPDYCLDPGIFITVLMYL